MPKSNILVIDDEELMREYVEETLLRAGYAVDSVSCGADGVQALRETPYDVVVTDLKMTPMDGVEVVREVKAESPSTHCIVMTAYGTIDTAVAAMKEGAEDYILKPFAPDALELAVERALERGRMADENRYLREALNDGYDFHAMIGESDAMQRVYTQIEKVARSRATVLLRGESGTGKELVARAIHYMGDRSKKPFIKVNCAALSAGLLESELFGHEKGSFTGAHDRKIGRFELADTGTLLLDEVSEIGPELQPKLLRALQEREIDRVGGIHPIQIDTRIIATSNRNLEKAVQNGDFREDLFFRLNVVPIQLPPLRERRKDILALAEHFLERSATENGRTRLQLHPEVGPLLLRHAWPGNVRELQNTIERAVVFAEGDTLTPDDFAFIPSAVSLGASDGASSVAAGLTIAQMERELILKSLERCNDNRTRAAEMLDISVRTLRNKLKEYREVEELAAE
ncbi:MAG: sigma-54-dependent Fis family transcriptional regulator [Candidatus Hydrogenedentes bacterium]|nr:sigma-54-dependent Fis family transcriptional regulator [Candidatus Hydrogenedentota bacterium]